MVIQVLPGTTDGQRSRALGAVPSFADTRIELVENPKFTLDAALDQLIEWTSERDERVAGVVGFGIFDADNVLQIEVLEPRSAGVRSFARDTFGDSVVRVVQGGGSRNTACNTRHDCWQAPTRGGLTIGSEACTTGAVAWKATGQIRMLTAGHCVPQSGGAPIWHDTSTHSFGGVLKNSYFDTSYTDFALLSLQPIQTWQGHKIYRSNSEKSWAINAVGSAVAGTTMRLSGKASGYGAADEVISTTYASYNDGTDVWLYLQALGYYEWKGGDSGGPVYYGHTIYGIQSGCRSIPNDDDCEPWKSDHSGDEGYFSQLDLLEAYARDGSWSADLFEVEVCVSGLSQCTQ